VYVLRTYRLFLHLLSCPCVTARSVVNIQHSIGWCHWRHAHRYGRTYEWTYGHLTAFNM